MLESTARRDEEQGPYPNGQRREKVPGEPQDTGGVLTMGLKQQLREIPALAITGPGYRAIERRGQSQVWAPGTGQLAEVM